MATSTATQTIWKYKLKPVPASVTVRSGPVPPAIRHALLPVGARVVHFAIQTGEPCIWAIVEPTRDIEARMFAIVGTGHAMPGDDFDFVATTIDGPLVWHLFERVLVALGEAPGRTDHISEGQ